MVTSELDMDPLQSIGPITAYEDRGIFPDHEVLSGRPSGLCT